MLKENEKNQIFLNKIEPTAPRCFFIKYNKSIEEAMQATGF